MAANQKVKLVKFAVGLLSVTAIAAGSGLVYQTQVMASNEGVAQQRQTSSLDEAPSQDRSQTKPPSDDSETPAPSTTGRTGRNRRSFNQDTQSGQEGMGNGFGQSDQSGVFGQPNSGFSTRTRTRHS